MFPFKKKKKTDPLCGGVGGENAGRRKRRREIKESGPFLKLGTEHCANPRRIYQKGPHQGGK